MLTMVLHMFFSCNLGTPIVPQLGLIIPELH